VAENVKEDWNMIRAFFNLTRTLNIKDTILFPQTCKRGECAINECGSVRRCAYGVDGESHDMDEALFC
jgi:hypothetical protein